MDQWRCKEKSKEITQLIGYKKDGAKAKIVPMLEKDPGLRKYLADTKVFAGELESPLHKASIWNAVDIIHFLRDSGCFMDSRETDDDSYSITPLHNAILSNRAESVRVLLECGADPSFGGKWNGRPF